MKISEPRIIVVDPEYLVAMEAERIIMERMGCAVDIAMPRQCKASLDERFYDVVVIDASLVTGERLDLVRQHYQTGTNVVFTAFLKESPDDLGEFPTAQLVTKPFNDEELAEAVRGALAPRLKAV